jgi:hypothetical protein
VALSGTPASSTTKIGRYDIAKILLKVALKHNKSPQKSLCQSSLSLSQNITKKKHKCNMEMRLCSDYQSFD